jgi:tetratricopeptide (TPR) repeat protein
MQIKFAFLFFLIVSCTNIQTSQPSITPEEIIKNLAPEALSMAGYGGYSRSVSTSSPNAQDWFDRGLQLVYGFNHDAAVYAFAKAAEEDPECPMAWWGIAYSYGVDVNNSEVTEQEALYANVAIKEAKRLQDKANLAEQAIIKATAKRAVHPLPKDRSDIDYEYSNALATAWEKHSSDADIATLYAESMMNMQSWNYWTPEGEPIDNINLILKTLDNALVINEMHPGANHFYIHAVEASKSPEMGVPSAERLNNLVPGSGHLVHMPSHIYINVGRYKDSVLSNQRAIEADDAYFKNFGKPTFYRLYFLHNMHFLIYSAMMTGQKEVAIDAVTKMENELPPEMLKMFVHEADSLSCVRLSVYLRFGMWEEILNIPEYQNFRKLSNALRSYTRTIAFANLKQLDNASHELKRFKQLRQDIPEHWKVGFSKADDILSVAELVAEGELYWRQGNTQAAVKTLKKAADAEDLLLYAEPPGWMIPVRHALGAILVASNNGEEAQKVYEKDLKDHPNNAWSLLGLQQSLALQDKDTSAIELKVNKAWADADISPPASCYCGAK